MEEKEAFEAIFLHTTDCILLTTPEGIILHANPSALHLLGFEQHELQSKKIDRFISTQRGSDKSTLWALRKDGLKFPIEIRLKPFTKKGVDFILQSITDTTHQQEKEKKIRTDELRYRAMVEQATDTIYISDGNRFLSINPAGCELFGYTEAEFLKLSASDITYEEDLKANPPRLNELRAGIPVRNERRLKRKDGSPVSVELTAKQMDDGNFLVVARDITERKKAEELLLKNEIRFKTLIENNNDIISLLDNQFRVIYRSPSAERIMGWSNEEILAMNGTVKVHPEEQDHAQQVVKEIMANPGKPIYTLFRNQHKNGHYVWLEGTVTNLLQDKHIHAIVYNYRDISAKKEAEEKLAASEIRFRSIIENSSDVISIMDENFLVIYRSPSAEKVLGWTDDDMKGVNGTKNIHPEDLAYAKGVLNEVMANPGKSVYCTFRFLHKQGHFVWVEGLLVNLLHNKNIKAIVFNYRDITQRIQTEEQIKKLNETLELKVIERTNELESTIKSLRESENKFEKVFQSNAAGISIVNLSTRLFVDVNKAFEKITGYSASEVIGKNTDQLKLVDNMEIREYIRKELSTVGSVKDLEVSVLHKSGTTIEVLTAAEIFKFGEDYYVLNIIYDITERKRIEEQLLIINKELEAFTYSVSHDLRAPLRAVNGYAQILSEDYDKKLDEDGKRILEIIKYNATKMGVLIDDLLTFSRLGRKEIQKNVIDLNTLVEGVIIEISKTTKHHAHINIRKLHKIKGDYALLNQAVINLIGNAIKYSSHKKEPVIEIFSEQNANETVFTVKDNGAGFDMRYVDKLFGVFQRLHSDEEFEGTGVGLAIVQRVIAKHGGRVYAEGKIDEGALFQFTLPEN